MNEVDQEIAIGLAARLVKALRNPSNKRYRFIKRLSSERAGMFHAYVYGVICGFLSEQDNEPEEPEPA
jgi:hypothetical protein